MVAKSILTLVATALLIMVVSGCDPDRQKKCEWYLVPEPDDIHYVANGWVSLCARNYVSKKQRCFLKMRLADAERVYNQPVKWSSVQLGKGAIKEILSYETCTQTPEDAALKR